MSKRKYLEDAALLIDKRVQALEVELKNDRERGIDNEILACDRSAIMEAKHLARLIRSLKIGTYRDPYKFAQKNFGKGLAADDLNRGY